MSSETVLAMHNVRMELGRRAALRDVNLAVPAGSIHGIIGANGAGKTTLLRLWNGVYRPAAGVVEVFGQPLPAESAPLRQRVHLVSADGLFYPGFRVRDLLRYAKLTYPAWDETRCAALVDALQLPLSSLIHQLSLGTRMQLRLAVALSCHPEVLLLDEPTNGLDPVVRRQFLQLLVQEAAQTGMTVVLATHRLEDLEMMADAVSVLYDGRVLLSGVLDTYRLEYREVIAMADELPTWVRDDPQVVAVHTRGKVHSLVVQGDAGALQAQLRQAGLAHVDEQPIALEELFRALMRREGYTREAVLFS